jgi:lipid-A-disaccharide synthase
MIIVSALDNSGQLYAAGVVRLLREQYPDQEFVGIGGRELHDAGCELVHDVSESSAMLAGVVGALKWAIPAYRTLVRLMKTRKVDLVILVDSPVFNFPLALAAKKRGIKTFYYIAPQVWAWAEYRIKKIQRRVDQLAVILPFEVDYFKRFGVRAEFVGHPFLNLVKNAPSNPALAQKFTSLKMPRLLLMPGSRRHVVKELLPTQLRVARSLAETLGPMTVSIAAWKGALPTIMQVAQKNGFEVYAADAGEIVSKPQTVNVFVNDRRTLIENSNLVLAASGTGTLEVAWHGRPMIIMYNSSKIGYHLIGRRLIKTKFLSLINILAGVELVPEFMPYIRDENEIVEKALRFLNNKELSNRLGWDCQALIRKLYREDSSRHVADLARGLMASDGPDHGP